MIRPRRTTYILGAGASRHAGYPFVSRMGLELLEWMGSFSSVPNSIYPETAEWLNHKFGDNIERICNGLDEMIRCGGAERALAANVHKPALIRAMREWFDHIHRLHNAHAYSEFASRIVQPEDRIVTFNYDVALDSMLRESGKWNVGDGYGFTAEGLPCGSTVKLLKLHGSINWWAVLFGGRTRGCFSMPSRGAMGCRPAMTPDDLGSLGYSGVTDPLYPSRTPPTVAPMILPTNRKQFFFATNLGREWASFWDRLWRSARRAIRSSDRIVICGYGLFPIDRRGCNLLLTGDLPADIEVCSASESERIVGQLRNHGRNAHCARQNHFEDWVSAH